MSNFLSQWLDDTTTVTFSNGKSAKLRDFDVLAVIPENGELPSVLRPIIEQVMGKEQKNVPTNEGEFDPSTIPAMNRLFNRVVEACWVEPPLVSKEEEAERKGIHIDRIPFYVKAEIFNHAMGGAAAIQSAQNFPQEPGAGMEPVHESKDI